MKINYLEEKKNNDTANFATDTGAIAKTTSPKPKYRFVMGDKKKKAEASGQEFTDTWTPPEQKEDYFPEPVSLEAFNALNPDGGNTNTLYSLKKAQREGTRIRNKLKNALSGATGSKFSVDVFDGIDDDTIEKNTSLADDALKRNQGRTLTRDLAKIYPNYRDGMAMMYAADEKGNKTAADAAKFVAYYTSKNENSPGIVAKNEPKTQDEDSHIKPTEIRVLGDNLSAAEIEKLFDSEKDSTIKVSEDAYTIKKTNYKKAYKPKNVDVYGLSGDDLKIPFEDRSILADYKKQYEKAEEELDYMKMNRIHKKAAKFRKRYYDYKDDYDYTHGGMYDIYTNYDDSYYENGYYEHVYRFDTESINEFFDVASKFLPTKLEKYGQEAIEKIGEKLIEKIADQISKAKKMPLLPIYVKIGLRVVGTIKDAYDKLKEFEAESFENAKRYGNNLSEKFTNDSIDVYVYLLNGVYSNEIKIRVTDKATGKPLSESDFDLRQDESYNSCLDSANVYGELVSVNRRNHKYSYVSREEQHAK